MTAPLDLAALRAAAGRIARHTVNGGDREDIEAALPELLRWAALGQAYAAWMKCECHAATCVHEQALDAARAALEHDR